LVKIFQGLYNRQKLGLLGIVGGLHTTVVGGGHMHIGHIVQLRGKMLHEAIIGRENVAKQCGKQMSPRYSHDVTLLSLRAGEPQAEKTQRLKI
jgi:hypothetical protein